MPALLIALVRQWRLGIVVVLLVVLAVVEINGRTHRRERDAARAELAEVQAAHTATIAAYQEAASLAARRDAENLARVQAEQRAVTEKVTDDYQNRLADSAAAYDRLRARAEAFARGAGDPDLSAARDAACRAHAGAPCEALPALLKAAQDNTDQLLALIAWSKAQGGVDVGNEAAK